MSQKELLDPGAREALKKLVEAYKGCAQITSYTALQTAYYDLSKHPQLQKILSSNEYAELTSNISRKEEVLQKYMPVLERYAKALDNLRESLERVSTVEECRAAWGVFRKSPEEVDKEQGEKISVEAKDYSAVPPNKLVRSRRKAGNCERCGIISVTWYFDEERKLHWLCEKCAHYAHLRSVGSKLTMRARYAS